MKNPDPIGQLESDLFDALGELRFEAQLLALKAATCQAQNLALADARGKQYEKLLCQVMALEHPVRTKARAARKRKATAEGGHGRPS